MVGDRLTVGQRTLTPPVLVRIQVPQPPDLIALSPVSTHYPFKLVMGILALIAEFENDIRRERQMDGIAKAKERGVRFGRKTELTVDRIAQIKKLRKSGTTVPEIMRQTSLSKASVYRAYRHKANVRLVPQADIPANQLGGPSLLASNLRKNVSISGELEVKRTDDCLPSPGSASTTLA
jgi:Helix-turn-helix domain of resolvase/Resolvase, N terminal domain